MSETNSAAWQEAHKALDSYPTHGLPKYWENVNEGAPRLLQ
jgi:hypothetical protein